MKALLRSNYQWIDVKYNPSNGCIVGADDVPLADGDIIATEDDERSKYVKCAGCGEILRNTKKNISEHISKGESSESCLKCAYMRIANQTIENNRYTLNPDGTYTATIKSKCKLTCGLTYRGMDINDDRARSNCKYTHCKEKGVVTFDSVFVKYPNVFDDVITVDALDFRKWKFYSKSSARCTYKAKARFNLYAMVNSMGIIEYFRYSYRSYNADFMYSKKYNKIFWMSRSGYDENISRYGISVTDTRKQELLSMVSDIYNKEN